MLAEPSAPISAARSGFFVAILHRLTYREWIRRDDKTGHTIFHNPRGFTGIRACDYWLSALESLECNVTEVFAQGEEWHHARVTV